MSNHEILSSEEIINRADQVLYRAKHDGKNRCVLWNGEVLALIYISVSVNKKEFSAMELNQLNFFADVAIPIFE